MAYRVARKKHGWSRKTTAHHVTDACTWGWFKLITAAKTRNTCQLTKTATDWKPPGVKLCQHCVLNHASITLLFNSNSMLHSNEYTSPSRKHTSLEITSNVMNNVCAISKVSYLWCTFTVLFQLNVMSRLALSILKTVYRLDILTYKYRSERK